MNKKELERSIEYSMNLRVIEAWERAIESVYPSKTATFEMTLDNYNQFRSIIRMAKLYNYMAYGQGGV